MFIRLLALLLLLPAALLPAQTPVHSEAEVHAYRQAMSAAGKALQQGDAQTAFEQVRTMADKGFPEAQYILATLYEDGEGTTADPEAAQRWYRAAAANSNPAVRTLAEEALAKWQ